LQWDQYALCCNINIKDDTESSMAVKKEWAKQLLVALPGQNRVYRSGGTQPFDNRAFLAAIAKGLNKKATLTQSHAPVDPPVVTIEWLAFFSFKVSRMTLCVVVSGQIA
jgi:hypothetical protein